MLKGHALWLLYLECSSGEADVPVQWHGELDFFTQQTAWVVNWCLRGRNILSGDGGRWQS